MISLIAALRLLFISLIKIVLISIFFIFHLPDKFNKEIETTSVFSFLYDVHI